MVRNMDDTGRDEEREIIEENDTDRDISLEEEESQAGDKIKKLQAKLKESESARIALSEDLQRAKADFLNAKKRLEEQRERDAERLMVGNLEALLPLCDSFEQAMKDPGWVAADEVWRKGIEGIYSQLQNILKMSGVVVIDPLGEAFNPHEHEALRGEGDVVTEVYQKGYKMRDIVIRPAKVSVETKE